MIDEEKEDELYRRKEDLNKPRGDQIVLDMNTIYKNQLKLQETQNAILQKMENGIQDYMKNNRRMICKNLDTLNKLMWAIGGVLVGIIATLGTLIFYIVT